MKRPGLFYVMMAFVWILPVSVFGQFEFKSASILDIIRSLEEQTEVRFLYRESQLAGIRIDLVSTEESVFSDLSEQLKNYQLILKVDAARNQALIFKNKTTSSSSSFSVRGQIVDAVSGERLPYATLRWDLNGERSGTASNSSGVFRISARSPDSEFTLSASYLGYKTEEWTFNIAENDVFNDVTLRLKPRAITNNEIIITGSSFSAFSDTSYQRFVNNGVLNPLGDNNTVKALQALPSVNTTTALNNGVNVRGSSEDATVVLLDGITIYNQSHLFGLLDSFNSNALQTSGFYYDVTPAQFQATPGATLSLITKTGSLNNFSGNAGFSNTSGNLTLEGPLKKGESSWLISGRTSYLNQLDWFGSNDLIAYGLNVDRPQEVLADNVTDLDSRLVIPGDSDALFYDIHAKTYFENENGSRLIASLYAGGDQVTQDAERFVRRFNPDQPRQRFSLTPVETRNQWGNYSGSLNYKSPIGSKAYSNAMVGFSIYRSEYSKDDFVYNRIDADSPGSPQVFLFGLRNESIFNELKADYSADLFLNNLQATIGSSYQYLSGEYYEESFDRPGLLTDYMSHLVDLYGQADLNKFSAFSLSSGLRLHYFSNGNFLRLSPRLKLQLWPDSRVSLGAGYSRNYQFTHRLSFYNVSSPDIWVISNEEQPPTAVDYLTGGLYIRPFDDFLIQIEAYYKWIENARLFDLNSQSLISSIESSPWLANYNGRNRGLEIMTRYDNRLLQWTNSYTYSKAEFTNPVINEASPVYEPGEYFYADWDRTHNYTGTLRIKLTNGLNAFSSLTLATGTPNRLYLVGYEDQQRLDNYRRLDLGIEYITGIGDQQVEFNASVYNVTDEQNPWYRELNVVIDNSGTRSQLSSQAVDVYDLGIQPSFNVTIWF